MEFIEYKSFFLDNNIQIYDSHHIGFTVNPQMIIKGEDHLSYITILKITEAFRDYYWSFVSDGSCDVVCKQIESNFFSPLRINETINCNMKIVNVSSKSIFVSFEYYCNTELKAMVNMQLVSYNPKSGKSCDLSKTIINKMNI